MNATDQQLIQHNESIPTEILGKFLNTKEGKTRTEYLKNLTRFFNWLDTQLSNQVQPDTLALYKMYLESTDLKTSSINAYLSPIKSFFNWCYQVGYLSADLGRFLTFSRDTHGKGIDQARSLTEDEVSALLKATSRDTLKGYSERIFLMFMFNLGLRVSEAVNIRLCDINIEKATIDIIGKGSKLRVLGLNNVLQCELASFIHLYSIGTNDWLLQTSSKTLKDKAATIQHGARVLKRTAKKANIDLTGLKSHSGRVTAINHLLDAEVSMRDVANFAGHVDINTTRRYDRKSKERVINTCNVLKFGCKDD